MVVGKQASGPLWADGQFTLRVRGPGSAPGRVVRVRRPFAIIGRHPDADVWIDDPAVEERHVALILDRRGLFGVDLLTGSGTRFAGAPLGSCWLSLGDILEVAGRRIELAQLRVDGRAIDPSLSDDDPLSGDGSTALVPLSLQPSGHATPPWVIGSALAFLGGGDACAIKVEDGSATDCALLRTGSSAYVIDLLGKRTSINDMRVDGAMMLRDGDLLAVGSSTFAVRIAHDLIYESDSTALDLASAPPLAVASDSRDALRAWLVETLDEGLGLRHEQVIELLREFRSETAGLLRAQFDRIEALNREIATLRQELSDRQHPARPPEPAPPLRMDLLPGSSPDTSGRSSAWLLERVNGLEREGRSAWRDLLGKLAPTAGPRPTPPGTASDLAPTRRGPA